MKTLCQRFQQIKTRVSCPDLLLLLLDDVVKSRAS